MNTDKKIREMLLELFMREELVDEWLNTTKWFFDDLTPLDMLKKANGRKAVLTEINRLSYGDFS